MVLAGEEPSGVAVNRLTSSLPLGWDEQTKVLGIQDL